MYAQCLSHRWKGAAIVREKVVSVEAAGSSLDHPDIDEAPNDSMTLVHYGFDQYWIQPACMLPAGVTLLGVPGSAAVPQCSC